MLSTVVVRRRALVAAGLFDETLRRGQDFELWLRLAWRGAAMTYQRDVLAERRVRAEGLSGDAVSTRSSGRSTCSIASAATHALDGRGAHGAADPDDGAGRSARDRAGQAAFLEGNFAAAQYHLSAARQRPLKMRLALLGLRLSPRLLRDAYLRFRPV